MNALRHPLSFLSPAFRVFAVLGLFVCPGLSQDWQATSGLPVGNITGLAAADGRVMAAVQTAEGPTLWTAVRPAEPGPVVFQPLLFPPSALRPSWYQWSPAITGLAVAQTGSGVEFLASTSTGIHRVTPDPLSANVLAPVWSWGWDSSMDLTVVGRTVLFRVSSFGSQSGTHIHDLDTGAHRFLHWGSHQADGAKLRDARDGGFFAWEDRRGPVWAVESPPPPVLFLNNGFSLNGGVNMVPYGAFYPTSFTTFATAVGEEWVLTDNSGAVHIGGPGQPWFQRRTLPEAAYATRAVLDPAGRVLVAADSSRVWFASAPAPLPPVRFQLTGRTGNSLSLQLSGPAGALWMLESSQDLAPGSWAPVDGASGTLPVAGTATFALPTDPVAAPRLFIRAQFSPAPQP